MWVRQKQTCALGVQVCLRWRCRESNPSPKDSPTDIYKLSLTILASPVRPRETGSPTDQPLGPKACLSLRSRHTERHTGICLADGTRRRRSSWSTGGLYRPPSSMLNGVRPRAGEPHRKCDWHLKVCAEFTGSAPPGLQPVTSLFRRSLSSPVENKIITCFQGCQFGQFIVYPTHDSNQFIT